MLNEHFLTWFLEQNRSKTIFYKKKIFKNWYKFDDKVLNYSAAYLDLSFFVVFELNDNWKYKLSTLSVN